MALELSEQRTSLEREVGRLEDLLEADANWRALRALQWTGAGEAVLPSTGVPVADHQQAADHEQERLRLERALKSNRVYCARERLLEAIELMDAEAGAGGEASAGAPDLFDERSHTREEPYATQAPLPSSQEGAIPEPAAFADKASANHGDAFRTRVKVKIRTTPPDTDPTLETSGSAAPPDDLTAIRGLNRSIAARLNALGVMRWEQIAAWRTSDVRAVSAALGLTREISRGNWIEQAALLAARAGRTVTAPGLAAAPRSVSPETGVSSQLLVGDAPEPAMDEPKSLAASAEDGSKADAISEEPGGAVDSVSPSAAVGGMIAAAAASIAGRLSVARAADRAEVIDDAAADAVVSVETDNDAEPALQVEPAAPSNSATTTRETVLERAEGTDGPPAASDALTLIRSITLDQEAELNALNVTNFSQIAGWDVDDVAHISVVMELGSRITRENWIEQAAVLARGELTAYARMQSQAGRVSVAPAPAEPLRADPQMQARLAGISQRLATSVAEAAEATSVAEAAEATPVAGPQAEPSADFASGTAVEPDAGSAANEAPTGDQATTAPAQLADAQALGSLAGEANQKEMSASLATVVLSADAAHALTAFASRQNLGSQLRQDVVIDPQGPSETSTQIIAPEVASETTIEADTIDSAAAEDDIVAEVVFPASPEFDASTPPGNTEALETEATETAGGLIDEASDAGGIDAGLAQVAVIDIPAEDASAAIEAYEAEVKLVPRGSPVPFHDTASLNETAPETEYPPSEAPASRSFAPRSTLPAAAEEFDDDDLPAWNGQIEEASVEIVPVAVRGGARPREYDEPAPSGQTTPAQQDSAGPNPGEASRSDGPDENEQSPVNRFLKALDGRA